MTDIDLSDCPMCGERVAVFLRDGGSTQATLDVFCPRCDDDVDSNVFRVSVSLADQEQLMVADEHGRAVWTASGDAVDTDEPSWAT